jgi:hypothetical protein
MAQEGIFERSINMMGVRCNLREFHPCSIYKISLNQTNNNNLFLIPNISNQSFEETIGMVITKLDTLAKKYKDIYIFNFCHANNMMQDMIEEKTNDMYDIFIKKFATSINNIISNLLHISNVELLGVANGNMIILAMIGMNNIYTSIYITNIFHNFDIKKLTNKRINCYFALEYDDIDTYYYNDIKDYLDNNHIQYKLRIYDNSEGFIIHPDLLNDITLI